MATVSTSTSQLPFGGVPTGHPDVDAALATLDRLATEPVAKHPEVVEEAHRQLHGVLTELDAD